MRVALIALLMLATAPAWAEWVKVDETDEVVIYVDPATIRKDGKPPSSLPAGVTANASAGLDLCYWRGSIPGGSWHLPKSPLHWSNVAPPTTSLVSRVTGEVSCAHQGITSNLGPAACWCERISPEYVTRLFVRKRGPAISLVALNGRLQDR